ncbi:hypothetical protein [Dickeya solani]|uniref:Uncharacterized protein n=1 Tax=Dickeya solani TaxID=1089444 RepID=A0AAX4F025_9GAMM|nr:hypothetical protein [Dickeya solani]WOA53030.1 hypothetical protein RXA29_01940 [Dickeya solani]
MQQPRRLKSKGGGEEERPDYFSSVKIISYKKSLRIAIAANGSPELKNRATRQVFLLPTVEKIRAKK